MAGCSGVESVLASWWAVEMFSPPRIGSISPGDPDNPVVDWSPGGVLPWNCLPTPRSATLRWEHTVYLGVYRLADIYQTLMKAFPDDAEAYDERPDGESACAALTVDQQGRLVEDTVVLSSCAWALGRISDPGPASPKWLAGFAAAGCRFAVSIAHIAATASGGPDQPGPDEVTGLDEHVLTAMLEAARGVAGANSTPGVATDRIRISSRQVPVTDDGRPPDTAFLNSFFLDDLNIVHAALQDGLIGAALVAYLAPDEGVRIEDRVDVLQDFTPVIAGTGVDGMPLGRWPSNPDHPLALSQQFAVNQAINLLGSSTGLLGVNGPPGTGKTTMLRDLVAANVVQRALRLADLRRPEDAFTGRVVRWKTSKTTCRVRQLRPEITGFEMIVASSNNAAVENITNELPTLDALDKRWRRSADYYAQVATEVLHTADPAKRDANTQAWGLLAARLGNSHNRSRFAGAFWFDRRNHQVDPPQGSPGLNSILKDTDPQRDRPIWAESQAALRAAESRVQALLAERRQAEQRIADHARTESDLAELPHRIEQLQHQLAQHAAESTKHAMVLEHATGPLDLARERSARHYRTKPGFLENLFSLGKAGEDWRGALADCESALHHAEQQHAWAAHHARHLHLVGQTLRRDLVHEQHRHTQCEATLVGLNDRIAHDETTYGTTYPGRQWLDNHELRECHGPWLDPELNEARAELFLAALRLHQAFLENTPEMARDLGAAVDVVSGSAPRDLAPNAVLAAWQLFFLAVPVVSTTFASMGRMFATMPAESVGWLFIDEAGQAEPQAAVGAIWRSRRVVIVGDPMQLTPVSTVPTRAQYAIARRFGVSDTWVPRRTSVQGLADRVSVFGTTMHNTVDPSWISAPLRVHHRCDAPMFDICNEIAYEGFMINRVNADRPDTVEFAELPPSQWIHVPAATHGSHLQLEEIHRLVTLLDDLTGTRGLDPSEIIAITPFRAVARQISAIARRYRGMRGGTIHTAQGKEAPVVFLVLGGDPDKPGAKRWVSAEPNMLNVAVSRAQHRFYVIADHQAWSTHPHFRTLATHLQRAAAQTS